MMPALALLTLALLQSCHSSPALRQLAYTESGTEQSHDLPYTRDRDIPSPEAFLGWRNSSDELGGGIRRPETYLPVKLNCKGDLRPSHPQQYMKQYHRSQWGAYDQFKLDGNNPLCAIKGSTVNPQGVLRCMRADFLKYVVLSDLFVDECGRLLRGFWEVRFEKSKEKEESLVSLGRSLKRKIGASFEKELEEGPTTAVPPSAFLFITDPEGDDEKRVARAQNQALANGWILDAKSKLWIPPPL
jgi:hypothetical protein